MLQIPLDQIIEKIKENSELSDKDINEKIEAKLQQLSGLISREGAAHIIANELGVKLFEQTSGKLQVKNILTGMRDVETTVRVTNIFPITEFSRKDGSPGKVGSFIAGDETGTIRFVLWGDQTNTLKDLAEGTIIKINGGYVRENQGKKEIHINERSKLILNPEGESIAEIKKPETQRKPIKDLTEADNNTEIFATVVQVFDPRFYEVCPECNKRARPKDAGFACEKHGVVTPAYAYLINLVLDDGTETIRTVFFRNQMEHLTEKTKEQLLAAKDNQESLEKIKSDLLGNQIKVVGRVSKNDMFDRMEFVAMQVFPKPDPKEEIDKLQELKIE
jgi:replication factor A1